MLTMERNRFSIAMRSVASVLLVTVCVWASGCEYGDPAPGPSTSSEPFSLSISADVDGANVTVSLALSQDGTVLAGTRTVVTADGQRTEEPITISMADGFAQTPMAVEGGYALPSTEGLVFTLGAVESH